MLNPLYRLMLVVSALVALPIAPAWAENAMSVSLGTTGVGLEFIKPFNDHLRGRIMYQYGNYEDEIDEQGIEYDAEWDSSNFGAVLDWHPFGGTFRLTGGFVGTDFGIDLQSRASDIALEIGDSEYRGNFRLDGDANFADVAPYLALGWSSRLQESGLYLGAELGVLYVGSANLSYNAQGCLFDNGVSGNCSIDVGSSPEFQADLEKERARLEEDLDDYSFWPILNLSIGYRF